MWATLLSDADQALILSITETGLKWEAVYKGTSKKTITKDELSFHSNDLAWYQKVPKPAISYAILKSDLIFLME